MKKKQFGIILLLSIICLISCNNKNEDYFLSSAGKKIQYEEFDEFLKISMDSLQIPGLAIAIIENSEVKYHRTFGVKNIISGEKLDKNTIFEAASLSKPLFAYFVIKQVEKGLIELDKPLYEYLPNPDIEYDARYKVITARMVLSHQSGFPNWRFNESDNKLDIEFDPGTSFLYSGEAYQYLAKVIAHINNVKEGKLDSIFQKEIAEPLGAKYLCYNWNDSIAKYKAFGHDEGRLTNNGIGDININEFGAAHSLHTNPNNFSKFIIDMLQKEILKKEIYEELLKEQAKVPDENILSRVTGSTYWGLGLAIHQTSIGKVYYHFGDNEDSSFSTE